MDTSGENAQEAFLCLKEISAPVKLKQGAFFGRVMSFKLEKVLRECTDSCGDAYEIAICFICLLTEKKCFHFIDPILDKIERMLNEKNGIIDITLESAFPADDDFIIKLEKNIFKMPNASCGEVLRGNGAAKASCAAKAAGDAKTAGVKIKTKNNPQLLGGYLLRMKSFYIDASLKGQLDKMKTDISARLGGINV